MWEQDYILRCAFQATEDDHWTLETNLGLIVLFVRTAPWLLALQAPWQPSTTEQQAPTWAWEDVLHYLLLAENPGQALPQVLYHLPGPSSATRPDSTWVLTYLEWHQD